GRCGWLRRIRPSLRVSRQDLKELPMKRILATPLVGLMTFASWIACPGDLGAQPTLGAADVPQPVREFTVKNETGDPIRYRVRWGTGRWDTFSLAPGETQPHSYPVDSRGQAPRPSMSWAVTLGDGPLEITTFEPRSATVMRGGYGPRVNDGRLVKYVFK